jgi:carbonic anhydrase/acetyltransferase-like protein (isoleucine patch superfamily)
MGRFTTVIPASLQVPGVTISPPRAILSHFYIESGCLSGMGAIIMAFRLRSDSIIGCYLLTKDITHLRQGNAEKSLLAVIL